MAWELIEVSKTDWIQDDSGIYTLINYVGLDRIRIDVMTTLDEPIISFIGRADDVRKNVMRWLEHELPVVLDSEISPEHAAYVGSELAKAELLKENYVQD